jgi:hypothetical protein
MSNFTDPVKVGFGQYLHRWHSMLIADTPALREFAARPFSQAAVWAPGRMVDQVEDMLETYRKNDNSGVVQPKTKLPIVIACMAKDFVPAPPEFGRGLADPVDVMIPGDPKNRLFKMRAVFADIRTQVAIIAADEPTARSLAMQLHLFVSSFANRTFRYDVKLAGLTDQWPCAIEIPDLVAMNQANEVKNQTVLALDINVRASVPMLMVPAAGEDNDGQGGANAHDPFAPSYDPNGYLVVVEARGTNYAPGSAVDKPTGSWVVGGGRP